MNTGKIVPAHRIFSFLLLFILFLSSFETVAAAEHHRLLVYMLACDLEADSGAATADLMEILQATKKTQEIEVIAYVGGTNCLLFPGLETDHCYDLSFASGRFAVLEDLGKVPSARGNSLLRFLKSFAWDDADLVLWGHGSPGSEGLGYDDLFDQDMLTLDEISFALEQCGVHFRLIGLDACSMARSDVYKVLAPYADILAASAETEALSGWNYPCVIDALVGEPEQLSESLRRNGLQSSKRDPSCKPLSVISTEDVCY